MNILKYFIIYITLHISINAQTIIFNEDSTAAAVENCRVYLPLTNSGILADVYGESINSTMTYDGVSVIYSGGFFLSGYADTTLWANGVASSSLIEDYMPGKIGSILDNPINKIYSVKATDTPFGKEWQTWKTAVEQGAYFYDGDGDGVYNPVDKNNNSMWDTDEDKPDILYDATLFTVYHDDIPPKDRRWNDAQIMGIDIRQTVFVSNRNTILDDVVFVRYSILYKGLGEQSEPDSLTNVIFGLWSDPDIGEVVDDLAGCDTLLNSGFTYSDSTDPIFGSNPPAVFKTIVQGPITNSENPNAIGYNRMGPDLGVQTFQGYDNLGIAAFVHFSSGDPNIDSPDNVFEARYFMKGLEAHGEIIDPCDWSWGEVRGDVNCSEINHLLWYSGNPVTNYGWINSKSQDQRDLTSTGTFTLRKNEPMDIIVAYTVGRGTDALNSITVARETVQYVLEEYERNFSTIVGVEEEEKEKLPSSFTLYQNYPNPFNPTTTIKFAIPTSSFNPSPYQGEGNRERLVSLIVYDILGREIKTLINKQLSPGEYEIEFDASDLPSGVYFYRLTAGSFSESRKMLLLK